MNDNNLSTKLELLKGVSLFATLKERELTVIAEHSEFYYYKDGEVIFHAGSYNSSLNIIKEGNVVISKVREDNENVNIARFIQGESFGELDLLENKLMTATAHSENNTTLLIFPEQGVHFQDVLSRYPEISAQILHQLLATIAGRMRNTNRLVSEKSQWMRDLKMQLFYDKLTGLYNRTFLEEEFYAQLSGYGAMTTIIMFKPDKFKTINDTWGHETGDRVLRYLAYCIKSQIREQDIPLRYRGDEFVVIFPDTDFAAAMNFAEDIRELFNKLEFGHIIGDTPLEMTASIGVAIYPDHAIDGKELVRACFNKMFEAREKGGNCIVCVGS